MSPSPRRPPIPIGGPTRPRRGRWRANRLSAPAVAVLSVVAVLVVAVVCTTGVELGRRLAAPSGGDPVAGTEATGTARRGGGSAAGGGAPGGSLPDRVGPADGTPTSQAPTTPSSTPDGTSSSGPTSAPADEADPYPGAWPYASWQEVADHIDRADVRFRTPEDTALRFAGEVIGLHDATVARTATADGEATVEVGTARGTTEITLVRAAPGRRSLTQAPWSVVAAAGGVSVDAPAVAAGTSLPVSVQGGTAGVVGLRDRAGWRGVAVIDGATTQLRFDPGAAGPALLVAFAGDPRDPAAFTIRRVDVAAGAGQLSPAAPSDPLAAVQALAGAVDSGDVGAAWELLSDPARAEVLDWRGLAGRLPALGDRLDHLTGAVVSTNVETPSGPMAVVAPQLAPGAAVPAVVDALVLATGGGAARLSDLDGAAVDWSHDNAGEASVVAAGPSRPVALVVDGAVWAAAPDGSAGLRAPIGDLVPGTHLAVALLVDGGGATASAHAFTVSAPMDAPSPPDGPDAPAPPSAPEAEPEPGPGEAVPSTTGRATGPEPRPPATAGAPA